MTVDDDGDGEGGVCDGDGTVMINDSGNGWLFSGGVGKSVWEM